MAVEVITLTAVLAVLAVVAVLVATEAHALLIRVLQVVMVRRSDKAVVVALAQSEAITLAATAVTAVTE